MLRTAKSILDAALGFFYPAVCRICFAEPGFPAEGYVGVNCSRRVKRIVAPWCERCGLPYAGRVTTRLVCSNCRDLDLQFRFARAAAVAEGVLLEAIHRYKYGRELWFEPFLAGLLVRAAAPALAPRDWDWIVPVPLHPVKQREREFNQAYRLAKHLACRTGIPVAPRLLRRITCTRTQTHLTRPEREANVRGAFSLRPGFPVEGQRFIIVDDVLTTGATTSACAGILREAGAADICVWTVARGV